MITRIPEVNSLELKVFDTFLYVPPITWHGDPKGHIGQYDVFFYLVRGECFIKVDDKSYILKAGELTFLPKGHMRTYTRISDDFCMYEIMFSAKTDGQELFPFLGITESVPLTPNHEKIKVLFETSPNYTFNRSGVYDLIAISNLSSIITEYVSLYAEQAENQGPFEKTVEYMRKNTLNKVTLTELAKISFMQPTYFIKKFKEAYGVPPMEYFATLKLYEAMSLLAGTQSKIEVVAKSVGFSDSTYFSRFFRKHTGLTPIEYRAIFK